MRFKIKDVKQSQVKSLLGETAKECDKFCMKLYNDYRLDTDFMSL